MNGILVFVSFIDGTHVIWPSKGRRTAKILLPGQYHHVEEKIRQAVRSEYDEKHVEIVHNLIVKLLEFYDYLFCTHILEVKLTSNAERPRGIEYVARDVPLAP